MKDSDFIHKSVLILILPVILSSCINEKKLPKNSIPDKETAIIVAKDIFVQTYGDAVLNKQPFIAELQKNVWIVRGTIPENNMGGVPYIEIRAKDGKIKKLTHGK